MFLALMGSATWVQYGQAGALNDDPRNVRTVYRDYGADRGPIVVAGEEVAYSTEVDTPFEYQRVYTNGPLFAHATGYFSMYQMKSGRAPCRGRATAAGASRQPMRRKYG